MKNLALGFTFCLLISGNIQAGEFNFPTDTLVTKDTLHKNSSKFQSSDEEKEINYDGSTLSTKKVRLVFNELFTQYLNVKDALVYNDASGAVRSTLKLLDDMKSKTKDLEELNKDYRWLLFLNNFDNIRNKVQSTTFIKEQRFLFNEITSGLSELIKQYGLYDKTLYYMQCTSDNNSADGRWFSGTRDSKNPYLGVLNDTTCTRVREVWKFSGD